MNGKQAKRLRRAAVGLAVSLTEAGKDIKKDGYVVQKHDKRYSPSSITVQPDGTEVQAPPQAIPTYQLHVRRDSLKGIYKQLKRGV